MRGASPKWLGIVSDRGESLKALVDEQEEILRGMVPSPRRQAALVRCLLMHQELNDGAKELGYRHLLTGEHVQLAHRGGVKAMLAGYKTRSSAQDALDVLAGG